MSGAPYETELTEQDFYEKTSTDKSEGRKDDTGGYYCLRPPGLLTSPFKRQTLDSQHTYSTRTYFYLIISQESGQYTVKHLVQVQYQSDIVHLVNPIM